MSSANWTLRNVAPRTTIAVLAAACAALTACAGPGAMDVAVDEGEAVMASGRYGLNTTLSAEAVCGAAGYHSVQLRMRTFALVTNTGPQVLLKWRMIRPDGAARIVFTRPPVNASGDSYWVRDAARGERIDQVEVWVETAWNSRVWFSAEITSDNCGR